MLAKNQIVYLPGKHFQASLTFMRKTNIPLTAGSAEGSKISQSVSLPGKHFQASLTFTRKTNIPIIAGSAERSTISWSVGLLTIIFEVV